MTARLIAAACLFAIVLAIQGYGDQRENVYALVFDDSNLFGYSKLPGWDADIGNLNTGPLPYRD
jgi:hypothetical protein